MSLGLEWDAYNDAMRLGSARVRIYRLEFKLPGERQITVRVSRVGEILQGQFPGQFRVPQRLEVRGSNVTLCLKFLFFRFSPAS